MKTLDRYLIREILPPFFLALGVFTFALAVQPMLTYAQNLLAKNVPLPTVGFLLLTLLPQSLGVTIPMALLAGLLMALGRLSGDREAVALLACGVNPLRLLRPILLFTLAVAALDLYVMVEAVPSGNQRFREVTFHLLAQQTDADVKAGLFYEGFPGKVLYVGGNRPGGGWSGVFLADTSQPGRPAVTLAESGQLSLDPDKHEVDLWLYQARRYMPGADPNVYDISETSEPLRIQIPADSVFGSGNLDRGLPEMYIADLKKVIAADRAAGGTARGPVMYLHQKFSFPVACVVFAMIGLALGLHTRKEGKLARPGARPDRDLRLLRAARARRDPHQGRLLRPHLGPLVPEHRPRRCWGSCSCGGGSARAARHSPFPRRSADSGTGSPVPRRPCPRADPAWCW